MEKGVDKVEKGEVGGGGGEGEGEGGHPNSSALSVRNEFGTNSFQIKF